MKAAKSFTDVLAYRGRILLFTPNAAIGLRLEKQAEYHHAQVICTRGWADASAPLHAWSRIAAAREYGVLSCDQHRYVQGVRIACTDIVWVGDTGDVLHTGHIFARFTQAMHRGPMETEEGIPVRKWLLAEDAA